MQESNQRIETDAPIHAASPEDFSDLIEQGGVVLVDFHAVWCGPCRMLEPTVAALAANTDATIVKVDIDELQDLAIDQGVRSVPTLALYVDGEEVTRVIGVRSEAELRDLIETYTS